MGLVVIKLNSVYVISQCNSLFFLEQNFGCLYLVIRLKFYILQEEREETFRTLKAGLLMFLELLEQSPEDSFSQEVICSDDEDVPLGKAYLHQLRVGYPKIGFNWYFYVGQNE